jgi:mRNA-degrading endonuclease HigB of HigAB toxin-antitoxin module
VQGFCNQLQHPKKRGKGGFNYRKMSRQQVMMKRVTSNDCDSRSDGGSIVSWHVMDDIDSFVDDVEFSNEELVKWIRMLQEEVRHLDNMNEVMKKEVNELKVRVETASTDIIGRSQKSVEVDGHTYRTINTFVVNKVFLLKKFVSSQQELDDFTSDNSLGKIVMDKMRVEIPDRMPYWSAYKEIVADAIANRRTTITNDMKKVFMSKL